MSLILAARKLSLALRDFPERAPVGPVAYILNPLEYAWDYHAAYLSRFAPEGHRVEAVLLGMNPGPWGMAQTGVPFGSPDIVRSFLKLEGRINPPARFHPKRPIEGVASRRNEVSGQRIWGAVRDCFGRPEAFFERFFVANYCPLVFQTATGANLTPDKVPAELREACEPPCETHFATVLETLQPRTVIGIGKWAEAQAQRIVSKLGADMRVVSILHPSPANPAANRGWRDAALAQLAEIGHPWPAPRD